MGAAVITALALAVGLLGVLVVGLLRSHAEILRALHDLGVNLEDGAPPASALAASRPRRAAADPIVGRAAGDLVRGSDISGRLPGGGAAHVAVSGVEHDTLLAFLTTGCGTCATFWETLGDPDERRLAGEGIRVVIVTQGSEVESEAAVASLAPVGVVTLLSSDAWDAYDVPVAPYFALVEGTSGRVTGQGAGASWPQVVGLLRRSTADQAFTRPADGRARAPRGNGADRADAVDQALLGAGIQPGDPSLYPAGTEDDPAP